MLDRTGDQLDLTNRRDGPLRTALDTMAGLGGMFLTGWQSKSQITHRYGTLADAVLGGHRSKVIFSGTDDPPTLGYVSRVAGTEHASAGGP